MERTDYRNRNVPFRDGFKIIQSYGDNPPQHQKHGFGGYEGVEISPLGKDAAVYALEDGIVLPNVVDPRNGGYGTFLVLWNQEKKRAWWYCQLGKILTQEGKPIRKGDKIATLTTGKGQPRMQLNIRNTDDNAHGINKDNGYQGFIDPLPAILSVSKSDQPQQQNPNQEQDNKKNQQPQSPLENTQKNKGNNNKQIPPTPQPQEKKTIPQKNQQTQQPKNMQQKQAAHTNNTPLKQPIQNPQQHLQTKQPNKPPRSDQKNKEQAPPTNQQMPNPKEANTKAPERKSPLGEGMKEVMRIAVLTTAAIMLSMVWEAITGSIVNSLVIIVLALILRFLDKWVHEYAKQEQIEIKGLLPF